MFAILCLSTKHRLIACHEVSRGALDATLVHPREVFKAALLANAAAIILAHNHRAVTTAQDRNRTGTTRIGAVDTAFTPLDALTAGSTGTTSLVGFFEFSNAISVVAADGDGHFGPRGTMIIPGADMSYDGSPEVATILSTADGSVVGTWPDLPSAETGDILPNGTYALSAQSVSGVTFAALKLFDRTNTNIASIPVATLGAGTWGPYSAIRSDRRRVFYVLQSGNTPPLLRAVSSTGTLGSSWTMPASAGAGTSSMAPALDGSTVYFGFRTTDTAANGVGRFSLAGSGTELDPLIPTSTGLIIGRDLLVTAEGHILVVVLSGGSSGSLRRYQDDGTLLATYPLSDDA